MRYQEYIPRTYYDMNETFEIHIPMGSLAAVTEVSDGD